MLNKLMGCQWCSESWQDAGRLVLRVVLGVVFFMHGYQKVVTAGVDQVTAGLFGAGALNWPMPGLWAYLVSYGELIGGALLIIGLCTHWASKVGVIIAAVALFAVHIKNGFFLPTGGYEYILLILAASIAVMTLGGGKYSVDSWYKNRNSGGMM